VWTSSALSLTGHERSSLNFASATCPGSSSRSICPTSFLSVSRSSCTAKVRSSERASRDGPRDQRFPVRSNPRLANVTPIAAQSKSRIGLNSLIPLWFSQILCRFIFLCVKDPNEGFEAFQPRTAAFPPVRMTSVWAYWTIRQSQDAPRGPYGTSGLECFKLGWTMRETRSVWIFQCASSASLRCGSESCAQLVYIKPMSLFSAAI
jgi:hypothetical protein